MSDRQKKFRFKRLQRRFKMRLQKLSAAAKRNKTSQSTAKKTKTSA